MKYYVMSKLLMAMSILTVGKEFDQITTTFFKNKGLKVRQRNISTAILLETTSP